VRLAQDDLFRAESRYTQALVDYQTSLAELYVALGRPLF
jgi:outer membrane protein TolC